MAPSRGHDRYFPRIGACPAGGDFGAGRRPRPATSSTCGSTPRRVRRPTAGPMLQPALCLPGDEAQQAGPRFAQAVLEADSDDTVVEEREVPSTGREWVMGLRPWRRTPAGQREPADEIAIGVAGTACARRPSGQRHGAVGIDRLIVRAVVQREPGASRPTISTNGPSSEAIDTASASPISRSDSGIEKSGGAGWYRASSGSVSLTT